MEAPLVASEEAGDILLTIYYFGDVIGCCEDYSTITSIISPLTETPTTIRDVKKSVAYFLRQSKLDQDTFSTGRVTISNTTISPLFAPEDSPVVLSPGSNSGSNVNAGPENASFPGEESKLPRGMLAVIAAENHITEILSNIERMSIVVGKEPGALNTLDNWCMQDSKVLIDPFFLVPRNSETAADRGWRGRKIDIILATGNKMPVPPPRVTIVQTTTATDIHGRKYTKYHMLVKQAGLEWKILHRFSDFVTLHTVLSEQDPTDVGFIPHGQIPDLPRKEIGPHSSVDDAIVKKRSVRLHSFIMSLLACPVALSNIHVLSFFGILNTSRHTHNEKLGSRNTIHLSKLKTDCRWGDLILFKCANSMSRLQRGLTGSEWDHVGIVVRGNNMSTNSLELLEATGEGVTSYPLFSRLRAYHDTKFADYMCLRRLDAGRDIELFQKLHRFAGRVVGKPYGFTFSKLISARSIRSPTIAPSLSGTNHMMRTLSESDLTSVVSSTTKSSLPSNMPTNPNKSYVERRGSKSNQPSENQSSTDEAMDDRARRMSNVTTRSSYCDMEKTTTVKHRSHTPPPRKSMSKREKLKHFLQEHHIYKPARKRSSDDVATNLEVEPDTPPDDRGSTYGLDSYFCSELVAACLQTMDLLPKTLNMSAFWPGSFVKGGDVDRHLLAGATYGEEYIMDCRVLEVSHAKPRESWSGHHSIMDVDDI